ncbi:MAG: zinc-binding dehydrogenase [Candidatus Hodarchaeota archaeon]
MAFEEELDFIKELIDEEKIKTVIDKSFKIEEMAEVPFYIETEPKKGHIVITLNH